MAKAYFALPVNTEWHSFDESTRVTCRPIHILSRVGSVRDNLCYHDCKCCAPPAADQHRYRALLSYTYAACSCISTRQVGSVAVEPFVDRLPCSAASGNSVYAPQADRGLRFHS